MAKVNVLVFLLLAGISSIGYGADMKKEKIDVQYERTTSQLKFKGHIDKKIEEDGLDEFMNVLEEVADEVQEQYLRDYLLRTTEGEIIKLRVHYDDITHEIANVGFHQQVKGVDGKLEYHFLTNDAEEIIIRFYYQNSKLIHVQLDTTYEPVQIEINNPKLFTVKSIEGEEIVFAFSWHEKRSINNINIKPKRNPFKFSDPG